MATKFGVGDDVGSLDPYTLSKISRRVQSDSTSFFYGAAYNANAV